MIYILPTDTCFWIACSISDQKNYEKIYKIKKRSLDKPLAVLVEDFKWLKNNTTLTTEQINFLENYNKPFTILTDCPHLKIWLNFVNEDTSEEFINRWVYEKIAFRVAHNSTQKRLTKENWPLFMTSANISNEPEIYNSREIKEKFWYYLDKWIIKFVWENTWVLGKNPPSEIFEFVWDSLEQKFLRK